MSCPDRQQLGSYLLEALDPAVAEYITFHLDVISCPFCRANLADLEGQARLDASVSESRHKRFFHSSRHLLSGDP